MTSKRKLRDIKTLQNDDGHGPRLESQAGPQLPVENMELTILQSLRRIIRAVDLHSRKLAANYGITGPQLVCLATLCDDGAMTSAQLSRKVFVSASTITGIIDRLERQGYVERRRDDIDRRRVLLQPTAEGFKLVYRAPSPIQDQLIERLRSLPELEQSSISISLQRIVDLMEARGVDASPILATGEMQDGPSARLEAVELPSRDTDN
jgi:DNA-binding MarR family transcriptional regulator